MYNRYKNSAMQVLPINRQIATVLSDISKQLQKSDELFRSYNVAESIEIGEKAVYKSIALYDIFEKFIEQSLNQPNVNDDVKKGLMDLKAHFEILQKNFQLSLYYSLTLYV